MINNNQLFNTNFVSKIKLVIQLDKTFTLRPYLYMQKINYIWAHSRINIVNRTSITCVHINNTKG